VTNLGAAHHDLKLCVRPVSDRSLCQQPLREDEELSLTPRQSATLTLVLSKTGDYEFLCWVTGSKGRDSRFGSGD